MGYKRSVVCGQKNKILCQQYKECRYMKQLFQSVRSSGSLFRFALAACLTLPGSGCNWVELVSVSTTGNQGDENSDGPSISANGRYVAFQSNASNLTPNDTLFASDVFVRDTLNGTTTRISVDNAGNEVYGNSSAPSVSDAGRYIAFNSDASNLVADDTNNTWDVFVHDRNTGVSSRVSVDSAGIEGNSASSSPSISGDGRYIAFVSAATNLVASGTTFDRSNIFVHDRNTATTTLVSVDNAGNEGNGGAAESGSPAISSDGRYVAFTSTSSNLVAGGTTIDRKHIFVHDRNMATTSLVSVDSAGNEGNGGIGFASQSHNPSISSNGRHIVFDSTSSNLVAGDTNNTGDVFLRDTVDGTTTRVNVDSTGNQVIGGGGSADPTVSADGRYIAFYSFSSNLVAGDTNGVADVFIHDRNTGATTRASLDEAGVEGNGASQKPAISDDGRYVAFATFSNNLVAGDVNGLGIRDIVIRAVPEVTVTSVTPNKLTIGATVPVTVLGSKFLPGSTPSITGTQLSNIVIVDEHTITMNVTVQANSPAGAQDVSVGLPGTGAGTSTGSVGSCTDCVTFKAPSGCG
jgi:Tol biopolymer transport system component